MTLQRLKPINVLKKKNKPFNIWGFDTETSNERGFELGVVYNPILDDFEVFYNPKEMANFLLKPIRDHYDPDEKHYMAAFNAPYDLNALHPHFNLNRLENKGRFITCTADKGTDRQTHKFRYFNFIDLNNFSYVGKTLKQLSDDVGVDYIDIHDYKNPMILDACKSHAKATSVILQKFQHVINNDFKSTLKLTVASTAIEIFQRKFLREGHGVGAGIPDKIPDHKLHQNMSYRGGITEMFNTNKHDNITCVDIKSMYPHIMRNITLPNMNKCSKVLTGRDVRGYLKHFEGCSQITVTIPENIYYHPFLVLRNNKLQAMKGEVFGVFTFTEIREMIRQGFKIGKTDWLIQFKQIDNFFSDFVDELYLHKNRDKTGIYKLILNSLYGKFGQKHAYDVGFKKLEDGDVFDINEHYELNGVMYEYLSLDRKNPPEFHIKSYPLIASYITAGARMYLYNEMLKVGLDKIIYCDTDSLMIADSLENVKKKICIIDKNMSVLEQLGKWDVKFTGEFQAKGLKHYRFKEDGEDEYKYVTRGVPEKHRADFWENNEVTIQRPVKFNTAIRSKGKKTLNEWIEYTLTNKNPPLKRKFKKDGTSEMWGFRERNDS